MAENFTDGSGDQPISWWMFEDTSSPALDGNGTNANNLTWGSSVVRSTSQFIQGVASISVPNGAGGLVRSLANLSSNFPFKAATTAFTIGGWIRYTSYGADESAVFFINTAQGFHIGYMISEGHPGAFLNGGGLLPSDATFSVAGWHHVVFRWNGDNRSGAGANDELSLWIDGSKQTTTDTATDVAEVTAGGGFFFNYGASGTGNHYDEWFAFNLALLDTQIADIYNHGLAADRNVNPLPTVGSVVLTGVAPRNDRAIFTKATIRT